MPKKHVRARRLPVPRTMASLVGVAAVATAAVGAADVAQEGQGTSQVASTAALEAPAAPANALQAHAARRAEVMEEASRGYARADLDGTGTDAVRAVAVERGDQPRTSELAEAAEAVAEKRSAAIERELARQRRFEEKRELARKRRIANRWVEPVANYDITATFGTGGSLWSSAHTGLDFAAAEGTPVVATAAGEVTSTGYDGAYGNQVVITHDDGTETWYCHLSSISVSSGESVEAGTGIGTVGSTGNTTGPHLHLEVHPGGGGPVDPYSYLQEQGAL